jgi:hypothetical protein
MKWTEPPRSATWLMNRLVRENEALAGDLLEEFHRRRSAAWYWRQVFGAVIARFSKQLRTRWLASGNEIVWTFSFATVWTCIIPEYQELIFHSSLLRVLGDWMSRQPKFRWPIYEYTIGIAASVVIISSGVALYLTIMRRLGLRRFLRGVSVGLFVILICNMAAPTFVEAHLLFVSRLVWRFGWGIYYGIYWLPLSLAVQFSLWATRSNQMPPKREVEI